MHRGKGGDDKHQVSGNVTTAIRLEDAPELNCVLKDGQLSTFTVRSVLQKHLLGTKKDTIQIAFLSKRGEPQLEIIQQDP